MGRSSGGRSGNSLSLWRRICAWLSRHSPQNRRPFSPSRPRRACDATLFIAAGMQHIFPIWAGAFPEADAAIALIGNWVRRLLFTDH